MSRQIVPASSEIQLILSGCLRAIISNHIDHFIIYFECAFPHLLTNMTFLFNQIGRSWIQALSRGQPKDYKIVFVASPVLKYTTLRT